MYNALFFIWEIYIYQKCFSFLHMMKDFIDMFLENWEFVKNHDYTLNWFEVTILTNIISLAVSIWIMIFMIWLFKWIIENLIRRVARIRKDETKN